MEQNGFLQIDINTSDINAVLKTSENFDTQQHSVGLNNLGKLIETLGVPEDLDVDLRNNKDTHLVMNALAFAVMTEDCNTGGIEEQSFKKFHDFVWNPNGYDINELLSHLNWDGFEFEKLQERMHMYITNPEFLPNQAWDPEFRELNMQHMARILWHVQNTFPKNESKEGGPKRRQELFDNPDNPDKKEAQRLKNYFEGLDENQLGMVAKLKSKLQPVEYDTSNPEHKIKLEEDIEEVTNGFNELFQTFVNPSDFTQSKLYMFLNNPHLFVNGANGFINLHKLTNEIKNLKDNEYPQKNKALSAINSIPRTTKQVAGDGLEVEVYNMEESTRNAIYQKFHNLKTYITRVINGECQDILNPDPHLFSSEDPVADSLMAFMGYLYMEGMKGLLNKSKDFENYRMGIFKYLAFQEKEGSEELDERESIAYALIGDIGSGKSSITAIGARQHGSGTDHIAGAANSQFHKVYQGLMNSWIPMRDKGYPIYPFMELLFESGLLGARDYYDSAYRKDIGVMLDGYPRNLAQLEPFTNYAAKFGVHNIEDKFKLVFMQFDEDNLVDPAPEFKELIVKRLILSRTFDGLGIEGSRKDHFDEMFVNGQKINPVVVVDSLQEAINESELKNNGWQYKLAIVESAYTKLMKKLEEGSITFNPKGRLMGYRNGMSTMEKSLSETNSPVKPTTIKVNKDLSREAMQESFADATFGREILAFFRGGGRTEA